MTEMTATNEPLTIKASSCHITRMNVLEWFAFDGLLVPLTIMAMGGWLVYSGLQRVRPDPNANGPLTTRARIFVYLKTDKPVGIIMVACGLLIMLLRLGPIVFV